MNALNEFEKLCSSQPHFHKIGSFAYEYQYENASKTLALVALVHGNEIGGLDILQNVVERISQGLWNPKINIRFVLGNVDAYSENKRFINTDLNRSFSVPTPTSTEEKRAVEIAELIQGSDILLDFHQTLEPSQLPFFIFNFSEENFNLARTIDTSIPIITFKSFSSSSTGKGLSSTANAYGIPALTIETGEKGIEEIQSKLGVKIIGRTIEILENELPFNNEEESLSNCFTWGEVITNPGFKLELVRRFKNFEIIKIGEEIAKGTDSIVTSPINGRILFPKYDEYRLQSFELVRILRPIESLDVLK